jgi:hypothetical protein
LKEKSILDSPTLKKLPKTLRKGLPAALRANAIHTAMDKFVDSKIKVGSAIDLGRRLWMAKQLAAGKRANRKLTAIEQYLRDAQTKDVQELHRMIDAAISQNDHEFFRRLAQGSKLAENGISLKVRGAKPAAVLAIRELWKQHRRPTREAIVTLVEDWRGIKLGERQWKNVFDDPHVAELLRLVR